MPLVRLEPATPPSQVKPSTTETADNLGRQHFQIRSLKELSFHSQKKVRIPYSDRLTCSVLKQISLLLMELSNLGLQCLPVHHNI